MSEVGDTLGDLRRSIDANRLGHAYVIVGSPQTGGKDFAVRALQLLYCPSDDRPCGSCDACRRVAGEHHPDVVWLEPRSKGRQILVDEIRHLNQRIATTSYEGGWKAGVILGADRMYPTAANAFLKTLEEPPPRSLLLLVTDAPQFLLPTIASRCHRIVLPSETVCPDGDWLAPLKEVLCEGPPLDVIEAVGRARSLDAIMEEVKKDITDEEREQADPEEDDDVLDARISARVLEVQRDVVTAMMLWHRDVLVCVVDPDQRPKYFVEEEAAVRRQAEAHSRCGALACVEAVEVCADRLNRHIASSVVFEQMMIAHGRARMQAR